MLMTEKKVDKHAEAKVRYRKVVAHLKGKGWTFDRATNTLVKGERTISLDGLAVIATTDPSTSSLIRRVLNLRGV